MWDNRCTQHAVINDFAGERVIQRVTVLGDKPEGDPPRWQIHATGQHSAATMRDKIVRTYLADHPEALADV